MKKGILIVLTVILLCVLAFSVWKMVDIWLDYRAGEQFYVKMNDYVSIPETEPTKPPKADQAEEQEETIPEEQTELVWPQVDFAALQAINSDVVGWIYIPDTNVNYPILQGKNNDQYIYHLMTGEYNSAGSIFLEAGIARDFSAKNSVIYGHNMKNGTMFHDLLKYSAIGYWEEHPIICFDTLSQLNEYQVVLAFRFNTNHEDFRYNEYTDMNEEEFIEFMEECRSRQLYDTGIAVEYGDELLTLSTCEYTYENGRFVVLAKKITE